ncbi:DUF5715 family protein [Flavobacterium faecale]|uniref:DUF5715 family protein n=1 Tax=Flavobacterium faecale TaxID=1355330 RepID=UPI003AACB712
MSKPKTYILLCLVTLTSVLLILYPYRKRIKQKIKALIGYTYQGGTGSCPDCPLLFTDNVATHEKALKNEGILPQETFKGIERLLSEGKLVKLKSNELYVVRKAKFSRPYLLPKGKDFINALAVKYANQCKAEKIQYIPFTISSVTRSLESVEGLKKGNGNAIKNSAHLKGKTFDISYRAFNKNKKQTKAFIKVLSILRKENSCFVKYEQNGCLHITVI